MKSPFFMVFVTLLQLHHGGHDLVTFSGAGLKSCDFFDGEHREKTMGKTT